MPSWRPARHEVPVGIGRLPGRIAFCPVEFGHVIAYNLVHQQGTQGGLMIELEIQALSARREGLLVEVGHFIIANGFTLQRQRLIQDPHGILLTMVVRGSARKKRALEAALDSYERIISFEITPFVEGEERPHFAATRIVKNYVPAPRPEPEPAPVGASQTVAFDEIQPATLAAAPAPLPRATGATAEPAPRSEPEPDFEFTLPEPPRAPAAAPEMEAPFVELVPLGPDQAAVDKLLAKLGSGHTHIMPHVLKLAQSVAEAARESSLRLAGQRIGRWVAERKYAHLGKLDLAEAIEQIGVPALEALIEVEQEGSQLHIHHSPLCAEASHSGCTFFSGFLEGVLGPALSSNEVTVFPVCCCSYGADDCVLALSD